MFTKLSPCSTASSTATCVCLARGRQCRVRLDFVVARYPGGPLPSVTRYKPNRKQAAVEWTELIDWTAEPPRYNDQLQPVEKNLQASIEYEFREAIISSVLYASAGRDFQSLGLGYLWVDDTPPATSEAQAAASVMRMLAQKWRWRGSDAQGETQPPGYVNAYLKEAAKGVGGLAEKHENSPLQGGSRVRWQADRAANADAHGRPPSPMVASPRAAKLLPGRDDVRSIHTGDVLDEAPRAVADAAADDFDESPRSADGVQAGGD